MKAQASTQMKLCQQAAVVPYCGVKIWKIMEMTTLTYLKQFAVQNIQAEILLKQLSCFMMHKQHTLICLINVESTLTDFEKFHPPQKKIPLPQNIFILILHKNCLSQSLAEKATCFTQYLSYLNTKGEVFSCNIDGFMATYSSKLKWVWQA